MIIGKMCQGLLHFPWYSGERLLTWKHQAIRQSVSIFQLAPQILNTKDNDSGLSQIYPTPTAGDHAQTQYLLQLGKERIRSEHEGSGVGSQRKKYDVPHSKGKCYGSKSKSKSRKESEGIWQPGRGNVSNILSNANSKRGRGWEIKGQDAKDVGQSPSSAIHRGRNFESRLGGKLSDGLSYRMDESEFGVPRVTTEKQDRAARLKAIGNAVIPTIPEIIARAIIEAEGA